MAVIQSGALGTTLMTVDTTMAAARVSNRPPQILGAYQLAATSGALTGAAAGTAVYSLRWAPSTPNTLCMIRRINIGAALTTAFTTAQSLQYSLQIARNWTVSDSGGTQVLFTNANSNKMRTNMPPSGFSTGGDIRIASTGALAAGTRVLDTNAVSFAAGASQAVGAVIPPTDLFYHDAGDYPIIFAPNEGFIINNVQTMGATGVINLTVTVEWMEIDATLAPGISF